MLTKFQDLQANLMFQYEISNFKMEIGILRLDLKFKNEKFNVVFCIRNL